MQIRIRYQRRDEATPHELELSPEEYFDPLDPGETLSVRSVPRFDNGHEYTPYPADELAWTVIYIEDGAAFWRIRTQLLDGMRSLMHHTQDSDGSEEIIHSTEIDSRCWHIVRTLKETGKEWTVVANSLTDERPDTLAAYTDFQCGHSRDQMEAFGDVR